MRFNINDKVRVKLTPFGRERLEKDDAEFWSHYSPNSQYEKISYVPPEEDEDGWSEWQLWVLMEKLGKYCHIGMVQEPFETVIEIVGDKDE